MRPLPGVRHQSTEPASCCVRARPVHTQVQVQVRGPSGGMRCEATRAALQPTAQQVCVRGAEGA